MHLPVYRLSRPLFPCCRQVAASALCRGGRIGPRRLTANVETEACHRDRQLRHHSRQHGVPGPGTGSSAQIGISQGQRFGGKRSVRINIW